jgi:hypothetical protein
MDDTALVTGAQTDTGEYAATTTFGAGIVIS